MFSVAPHAEIGFYDTENGGSWQDLRKMVAGNKNVLGSAPYIADQALLANNGVVRGVQVRGIDPQEEKQVVDYWKKMTAGKFEDLKPGEFDIILGQELANELGAEVGGKVTVKFISGATTLAFSFGEFETRYSPSPFISIYGYFGIHIYTDEYL